MDKSLMLLSFLQKNCNIEEQIPNTPQERFDFYKRWVNKLPKESVSEGFLKVEDGFLSDVLKEKKHRVGPKSVTTFSCRNRGSGVL